MTTEDLEAMVDQRKEIMREEARNRSGHTGALDVLLDHIARLEVAVQSALDEIGLL
jgi:hypothetical protein